MDLHYVVEEVYGLKIEIIEVYFSATYLRGKTERYTDNRARVLVRSNMSEQDKRLATVKELCHLALDEKDDWSSDGAGMLEALIADCQGVVLPPEQAKATPLESEAIALLAAGELMYPSEFRDNDAAKVVAKEVTVSAIAIQHDVPPFVVEQALRQESRYKALRAETIQPTKLAAE
jgi:hypothetical protein